MADEQPSNAELAWRMADMQRLLGELVSKAEYQARLDAAEHRFAELAADVAELRRQRDDDIARLREGRFHWQQVIIPSVVAFIAAMAGVLTELWVAMHR